MDESSSRSDGAWSEREDALAAAQESVAQLRSAARTEPGREPELGQALYVLSIELGGFGRRQEACDAAEESAEIFLELVRTGSDPRYGLSLGISLDSVSIHRAGLGRKADALLPAQEAVRHLRLVEPALPVMCGPYLAGALRTESSRLRDLGRDDESLEPVRESADRLRELAVDRPGLRPVLGSVLGTSSDVLADLGRLEEAVAPAEEALDIAWRSTTSDRVGWFVDLSGSMHRMAIRLADLGRLEEAVVHLEYAVRLRRIQFDEVPDAEVADLARSLTSLARVLAALGRRDKAIVRARDAAEHYRRAAALWPEAYAGSAERCERLVRELADSSDP